MRLTTKAVFAIKTDTAARAKIALVLNKTDNSVLRWLNENKPNNPLTTVAALNVIKRETGLLESEILEETPTESIAA